MASRVAPGALPLMMVCVCGEQALSGTLAVGSAVSCMRAAAAGRATSAAASAAADRPPSVAPPSASVLAPRAACATGAAPRAWRDRHELPTRPDHSSAWQIGARDGSDRSSAWHPQRRGAPAWRCAAAEPPPPPPPPPARAEPQSYAGGGAGQGGAPPARARTWADELAEQAAPCDSPYSAACGMCICCACACAYGALLARHSGGRRPPRTGAPVTPCARGVTGHDPMHDLHVLEASRP